MSETPEEPAISTEGPPPAEVDPPPAVVDPPRPQTTSDLLKIQRALSGDAMWGFRLEIAFKIEGKSDTMSNRIKVTQVCVDGISCDIDGTVSTENVTDTVLIAAVASLEGGAL